MVGEMCVLWCLNLCSARDEAVEVKSCGLYILSGGELIVKRESDGVSGGCFNLYIILRSFLPLSRTSRASVAPVNHVYSRHPQTLMSMLHECALMYEPRPSPPDPLQQLLVCTSIQQG